MDHSTEIIFSILVQLFFVVILPVAVVKLAKSNMRLKKSLSEFGVMNRDLENRLQSKELEFSQFREASTSTQQALEEKIAENEAQIIGLQNAVQAITNQFVNDCTKYICEGVTASNYQTSIKRLEKVFKLVKSHKIEFSDLDVSAFFKKLDDTALKATRIEAARQEQQRIREQIRDEARAQKERDDEIKRLDKEQNQLEEALRKAVAQMKQEHSEEVEELRARLAEAQAKAERAKSQAQLTKSGYVYVISNIGSFGDGVFKVGMTRRLTPLERIKELGDASVPFPFDVHLMIASDDAPTLENSLHRELHRHRINKVNLRKEFFRLDIQTIVAAVEKNRGKVEYRADPEAFEFRETRLIEERGLEIGFVESNEESHEDEDVAA